VSDGGGHFVVNGLMPVRYHVRASLDGFETLEREAIVPAGGTARLMFDLVISAVNEHVDVVPPRPPSRRRRWRQPRRWPHQRFR
jgi:hypothetical protein